MSKIPKVGLALSGGAARGLAHIGVLKALEEESIPVDMITEPGPNKILGEKKDNAVLESIRKWVEISITRHASNLVAIVGHHDCAGNPVGKKTQLRQIITAIKTIESWGFDVKIMGIWVDENWEVYEAK